MPLVFQSELVEAVFPTLSLLVAEMGSWEILYASGPLEEMFGYYVKGELTGCNVKVLIPEVKHHAHDTHLEGYYHNPKRRPMGAGKTLEGQHRDGHVFPVVIDLTPIMIPGRDGMRKRCVVAQVIDMTGRAEHKA